MAALTNRCIKAATFPIWGIMMAQTYFPLVICDYEDFRPIIQAASCAFLGKRFFPHGAWDELSGWFDIDIDLPLSSDNFNTFNPSMLRIGSNNNWGYLRAATLKDRPAHADQLQVDPIGGREKILPWMLAHSDIPIKACGKIRLQIQARTIPL